MAVKGTRPSSMATSMYCPLPVRLRYWTAARMPTTEFMEPTQMSAIWMFMGAGPASR